MSSGEHKLYATWVKAKELDISPKECLFVSIGCYNKQRRLS
jgi:hypothetical protein